MSQEQLPCSAKDFKRVCLEDSSAQSIEVFAKTSPMMTSLQDEIQSRIYVIRGVQVMLDSDLAKLYHVETRVFNQAVKRNEERFPEGFRFQLTREEHQALLSQIVTAKREKGEETRGGQHNRPYAFTEQGIAMLSGVLKICFSILDPAFIPDIMARVS